MQQTHWKKEKKLKRSKGFKSSVKGVSHLSRRAKRRLYCKLQFWTWRKQREKCRFVIFRSKRNVCGLSAGSRPCLRLKTQLQKNKRLLMYHTLSRQNSQVRTSAFMSPIGRDADGSEEALRLQNGLLTQTETVRFSEALAGSRCSRVSDRKNCVDTATAALSQNRETWLQLNKVAEKFGRTASPLQHADSNACEGSRWCTLPRAGSLEVNTPSEQPGQNQTADRSADGENPLSAKTDVSLNALTKDIQETTTHGGGVTNLAELTAPPGKFNYVDYYEEDGRLSGKTCRDFLDGFYRTYGSFIPLRRSDVMRHLKQKFNSDFGGRKTLIFSEVSRCQKVIAEKPDPSFQVVYKKHVLTLEDLSTLADQNWLNDQVMNMYGELIMESSHHKVHFLNSFFHRQLMMKGYDGVKRWTKQVDLFSKSLLLVPVHLEVHWCLVTADMSTKKICLYDSQGNALQKVARNILKYLMTEAKEKQQSAFRDGWTVSFDEKVPQQTNENDCGVFVLQYSRCLALLRALQFSQKDIPKIRKRIYRELCDCTLHEED